MISPARRNFLGGLDSFRRAVDVPEVRSSDTTGDFLRRGLTVAAYNLLETFIADRLEELAPYISAGHTQFRDLPERLQKRAITQSIAVAANKARRLGAAPIADLRGFSAGVGQALAAVDRALELSPFMWMWSGSNMTADEYATSLRYMHVQKPWETIRLLGARLGFTERDYSGQILDLRQDLTDFALERHKCAHVASYGVTTIWIRALPDRVLRYAVGFDTLSSIGAFQIRTGSPAFFADDEWISDDKIMLRYVRERKKDFAEFREKARKASFTDSDGDSLFSAACHRSGDFEVVVRQGIANEIVSWSIPLVDG